MDRVQKLATQFIVVVCRIGPSETEGNKFIFKILYYLLSFSYKLILYNGSNKWE